MLGFRLPLSQLNRLQAVISATVPRLVSFSRPYHFAARAEEQGCNHSWTRFGSQHQGACGRLREGVVSCRCESPGVIIPGKFLKTQMLNPAFCWLLTVKFLAFWKLRPRSWGTNTLLVPNLKVWGTSLSRSQRLLRLWMIWAVQCPDSMTFTL